MTDREAPHRRVVGERGPIVQDGPSGRAWLIGVITVVLVGWALKATALITMPLFFALFVAFVVWPVDGWVQARVPGKLRWLGHAAAMTLVLAAILLFLFGLYFVAQSIAGELPDSLADVRERVRHAARQQPDGTVRGALLGQVQGFLTGGPGDEGGGVLGFASSLASRVVRSAGTTLSLMALIFFFALIMLTEAPVWRAKLEAATSGAMTEDWRETVISAGERFRWYLLVRTVLAVATALLYGAWLMLFGVEFVGVWVVLTFLLGYVPTLGSLISGALPFGYALATKDIGTAFLIGGGLLVIEQVMGNFVDPKLQGKELSISPLMLLFSLLLWGYLWGIAGTLIAVPMTALLVVAFAHIEPLRPVALMLSGSRDYAALDEEVKIRTSSAAEDA